MKNPIWKGRCLWHPELLRITLGVGEPMPELPVLRSLVHVAHSSLSPGFLPSLWPCSPLHRASVAAYCLLPVGSQGQTTKLHRFSKHMWKRKHAEQFDLGCSPLINKLSKNMFHRIIYRVGGFGECEAASREKKLQ